MNCAFSQPVNYTGEAPKKNEPFAFTQMVCDGTTGAGSGTEEITGVGDFWISKQLDYGQVLILTFLLIFFVGFITKSLWNFVKQDSDQKL
jgi:hypothetical protein